MRYFQKAQSAYKETLTLQLKTTLVIKCILIYKAQYHENRLRKQIRF